MKIAIDNTEKVQATLDQVQKRCRKRLFTADELAEVAREVEQKLAEAKVPKSYRQGTRVLVDPYRVCNSYGYYAEATSAELERGKEKWFITRIKRNECPKTPYGTDHQPPTIFLPLTREVAACLVRNAGFSPFWPQE